eukprot:CAMPEP_0194271306 /NCGR_PEP_ID=MMETSP0169-20130528/5133_1 /TAXON_ID=218684 /ORGANISM="Corethron pennatum, Strain L29A3" /LENGTH=730 /DNA_ID=CAMNT_0039013631 /DNA_START=262 /DNA_END=2454 /DNA_ORIENTATION=+
MTPRERTQLAAAGLLRPSKRQKKTTEEKVFDPSLPLSSADLKFGRALAHPTDPSARHRAIGAMRHYLRSRTYLRYAADGSIAASGPGLSETDLLRLWRGLWYTLYLADGGAVQREVSGRIAALVWCVCGTREEDLLADRAYTEEMGEGAEDEKEMEEDEEEEEEGETTEGDESESESESGAESDANFRHCRGAHTTALVLSTFLRTVAREWPGLDRHRLDKFYTLVRLVLRECYQYLRSRGWPAGLVTLFNEVIYDDALQGSSDGARLHLVDVALDEIARASAGLRDHAPAHGEEDADGGDDDASGLPPPREVDTGVFLLLLEPYLYAAQTDPSAPLHRRVVERILAGFLTHHGPASERAARQAADGVPEGECPVLARVDAEAVARHVFEMGADEETLQCHRPSFYDMYKDYQRRIQECKEQGLLTHTADNAHADEEMEDQERDHSTDVDGDAAADGAAVVDGAASSETKAKENKKKKKKSKKEKAAEKAAEKNEDGPAEEEMGDEGVSTAADDTKEAEAAVEEAVETEGKKKKKKSKKGKSAEKSSRKDEDGPAKEKMGNEEVSPAAADADRAGAEAGVAGTEAAEMDEKKKKKKKSKKEKAAERAAAKDDTQQTSVPAKKSEGQDDKKTQQEKKSKKDSAKKDEPAPPPAVAEDTAPAPEDVAASPKKKKKKSKKRKSTDVAAGAEVPDVLDTLKAANTPAKKLVFVPAPDTLSKAWRSARLDRGKDK